MKSDTQTAIAAEAAELLTGLGVREDAFQTGELEARSPITGESIGRLQITSASVATRAIEHAHTAFLRWRKVPAPARGELVRAFGEELRRQKQTLGRLVTAEAGKILPEGAGEVQEMIDICTFAAGLSRQLDGLTIASERPRHLMMETWHPLGVTGVITAFNFPVAVWAWNAALALVCGNTLIWKPSEKTTLCALAVQAIFERVAAQFGETGLSTLVIGGRECAEILVDDPRVPLVSATGSTAMGKQVAPRLAARFARAILELGGNNGAIVCPSADLELTVRAVAFAAMGTAGQRCTTLRRLFVHEEIYDAVAARLQRIYASVSVGDPRQETTLVGPLIDARAYQSMQQALAQARQENGRISGGERLDVNGWEAAFYVRPALVEMPRQTAVVMRETFAPVLYLMPFRDFDEAIREHNAVQQGLSSAIFTNDLREAGAFLSAEGSDCGIANVNIGTSGAEIGGAFGGEKETGGGRESGSDAWKAYMRRATNTINYGSELPLAQGIRFDI
jgi:aldehyde dehydrogenase (NAD+)